MPHSAALRSKPCRILSVHDDIGFQSELWRVAAEAGHVVTALTSAEKVVEVACRLLPDAVFLNLGLRGAPGRDGRDTLAALKANPTTMYIPVLGYHPRGDGFGKRQALELGAEDVFSDPMDQYALVAKVERVVLRASSGKFPTI